MFLKTILALAAIASTATVSVRADGCSTEIADALKVMSFNVRTSQAPDPCPSGCWAERKTRVQRMLAAHDPDFIGTQETAPDQTAFFKDTLQYASVGECAGPCDGNERDAIFFRASKWDVVKTQTFALSDTPDVIPSNSWNLEYLRAAVMARFRSTRTGNTVCMLNTHYDITRGQDASSVLVADRFSKFCEAFDTVVFTGDLNTLPTTSPILYLEDKIALNNTKTPIPLYETLTAAGAGGPTWIGSSFGNETSSDNKKIDYIFARRDAHTCLQKGQVILDSFDEGSYSSSDHAVVMSTFCIGHSAGCSGCL